MSTANHKITRRKKAPKDKLPEPLLLDGATGMQLEALDPSAVIFLRDHTGNINIVAKSAVSNLFRRSGRDAKYYRNGIDTAPKDSGAYMTVEELEEFIEELDPQVREEAQDSLTEDERRQTDLSGHAEHITENAPPIRDEK